MADNVTLPGTGAAVASDDVGGVQFQRVKLDRGADGASTPVAGTVGLPVELVASEAHVGQVGGAVVNATANFSRPADTTAYAANDLVANSTTAGSVAALQLTVTRIAAGSGLLRRLKLHKSGTSVTNANFRVHFFSAAPTVANGDNGAFSATGVASYLGAIDVNVGQAFTDGAAGFGVPNVGGEIAVKLSSGQIVYALVQALAAYTPANAETFTLTAEFLQD
jgi:hypothetical protein